MEYFYLLIGFIILMASGHFLVKGSVELASRIGVSILVIGVTVVSFATSAPELIVSLQAVFSNHPEIAIGNVVGSNISNIALVLALTAIVTPIPVKRKSIVFDWPIMMFSGILFLLFISDEKLQVYEGIIFYSLLILYIYWSIKSSRREERLIEKIVAKENNKSIIKPIFWITLSAFGLWLGSKLLIANATLIAQKFYVSERVISITLIAFGTSVPELATSVIAAFKKQTDISIGNIIGSNIFNLLGILGMTSMFGSIRVVPEFNIDIYVMLFISLLLFLLILPLKGGILKRYKGVVLLSVYVLYMYYLFVY